MNTRTSVEGYGDASDDLLHGSRLSGAARGDEPGSGHGPGHGPGHVPGHGHASRPVLADPRPLFGFFSRLPIGTHASLDAVTAAFPLVPMVGWVIGAVGAAATLVFSPLLPGTALGALILVIVVGLTGLNQTDGLLDLGDGLMVHGDVQKRLRVMHEHSAGVGAVAGVLFTYLLSYAALAGLAGQTGAGLETGWLGPGAQALAATVILAEVTARLPYLFLAWLGRPSHAGLGSRFLLGFAPVHVLVGVGVAAPAVLAGFWLGWVPLVLAFGAAATVTAWTLVTANRLLGGVGGDVMGASQELARTAVLLAVSVGLAL